MTDTRQTDVQTCYAVTCQNNNALVCDLIRVSIGMDATCGAYTPTTEKTEGEEATAVE